MASIAELNKIKALNKSIIGKRIKKKEDPVYKYIIKRLIIQPMEQDQVHYSNIGDEIVTSEENFLWVICQSGSLSLKINFEELKTEYDVTQ